MRRGSIFYRKYYRLGLYAYVGSDSNGKVINYHCDIRARGPMDTA